MNSKRRNNDSTLRTPAHPAGAWLVLLCTALLCASFSSALRADTPQPFAATYEARYDNFRAEASRGLTAADENGLYGMYSELKLKLLGKTLVSIDERSQFRWEDDALVPVAYEFVQKGLGARTRSARFDHTEHLAEFRVNERQGMLPLDTPVFDELSAYLQLQQELKAGKTEIEFRIVDRDEIETMHFRVLEQVLLQTELGEMMTTRLERVREEGSKRHTEIWLAPDLGYMLVKLIQTEPNGRTIRLDISEATRDGAAVQAR